MGYETYNWRPETLTVKQSDLDMIGKCARMGLKDETIAAKCRMSPTYLRQLAQFIPEVELALLRGRADMEYDAAEALTHASNAGDVKASLAILQHKANWVSKQEIDVSVTSINLADVLKEARERTQQTIDMDEEDEQISNIKQIERIPKAIEQPTEQPVQQRRRRHG